MRVCDRIILHMRTDNSRHTSSGTRTSRSTSAQYTRTRSYGQIVPIDSTLHERSVMQTLLRGVRCGDVDYLIVALQSLCHALHEHTNRAPDADTLLDAMRNMLERHCDRSLLRWRIHGMWASGLDARAFTSGSEHDYACCMLYSSRAT